MVGSSLEIIWSINRGIGSTSTTLGIAETPISTRGIIIIVDIIIMVVPGVVVPFLVLVVFMMVRAAVKVAVV